MFHHHHHRRHRHGWGRWGGGSGRMFRQGDLRLLLLALIAETPRHGYELIREIEARLAGAYAPSPGVVYPTLTLLEEMGFVTSTVTEGTKRQYTITPEGEAHLAENQADVDAIFDRMAEAGGDGDVTLRIVRAMANLRTALKLRLARGNIDDTRAGRIAAALDAAALEVERA